ncbi:MAG: hypothetical protein J6Q92_02595 [Oscillospiraceae bacterium]|nr:hypothetical protein [Oscillospiraceae bacterium]
MEYLETAAKVIGYLTSIGGLILFMVKVWKEQAKSKAGQLCLLRAEMLKIYYKHCDCKTIRQYEAENFVMMYEAYKARGGNSFIDEVYEIVTTWKLES